MPAKRTFLIPLVAALVVAGVPGSTTAQEILLPFVTVSAAPEGGAPEVGDHYSVTEMSNSKPVADGAVGPLPIFAADDDYGCEYTTALASGVTEWIAVAVRNGPVPDGLLESPCALFQAKIAAATAAGAEALIIVNIAEGHEAGTAAGTIPAMMIDQTQGQGLIDATDAEDPDAVQVRLEMLNPDTMLPPGTFVPTSIDEVSAGLSGDALAVTGKATFRGEAPVLMAEDPAGDGPILPDQAATTGVDLVGGYIYQPDPDDPRIVLEWRVTGLPASGSLPEIIRYGFPAKTATTDYQIQAKFSNLVSTTLPDDPQGHAEHVAGTSFQLRGDCGPLDPVPVNSCRHLAWLDGEFDTAENAVRAYLPIGSSVAPTIVPGAVLEPNPAAFAGNVVASYQAVVSNTSTQDDAFWDPENTYTVPERTVRLGLVPVGAPAAYTATLNPSGSTFGGSLGVAGLTGDHDLVVQACFGTNCATSRTTVTL